MTRIRCPSWELWPRGVPSLVFILLALLVNNVATRDLQRESLLSDAVERNTLELEKNGKRPATPLDTRLFHVKPATATFPSSRAEEGTFLRANIMHRSERIRSTLRSLVLNIDSSIM